MKHLSNFPCGRKSPELSGLYDCFLKMPLCHQDLYVERLTKDLENRVLQVAGYEVQGSAQAQETWEATKALSEVTVVLMLKKEMSTHQTELSNQRNQVEKLSAARLELEESIMANIQQQLTHSKAATYSQQLTSKMATQKKEKIQELVAHDKNDQSLWLQLQGTLVELGRELEVNSKKIRKLQKDYTGMQQREIRLESEHSMQVHAFAWKISSRLMSSEDT
ncbi:hypothetical protein XENOCAPTIV_002309 [Xenoophorus captivus]|uniref:Uncharacterized protein n=1 Tax=Xenoophorus captivus TaxID=1517983 RepID=A0ABV0RFD5_9TELE